ncbi:MAG TPA: hypothetical protein VGS41_17510, partial [Chthonomonadales bacterium]|nr:hypothetical protein [Chthonomonadales bacterium]
MATTLTELTRSLWSDSEGVPVADVLLDHNAPDVQPVYSYRVPASLEAAAQIGCCVHVPFSGRTVLGYIIRLRRLDELDPLCDRLKSVIGALGEEFRITDEQLRLAQWMQSSYLCDLITAVRCVAPTALSAKVSAVATIRDATVTAADAGRSISQRHLLEVLLSLCGRAQTESLRRVASIPDFAGAYTALKKKGLITESLEVAATGAKDRTVKYCRLAAAADTLGASENVKPLTKRQQKLVDVVTEWSEHSPDPMPQDR